MDQLSLNWKAAIRVFTLDADEYERAIKRLAEALEV